jgi:hypothetical protein
METMTLAQHAGSAWVRLTEGKERIGFWLGLLLLFVPVFWFLLFFRRYSWLARAGWGLWLGFIVFVKVFGLSEPILQIKGPDQLPTATFGPGPQDLPIGSYVGKLLGSQYMEKYHVDGNAITITYERKDAYFDNVEVLADLAISNGFSLMFRRDFHTVRLDLTHGGKPLTVTMTREAFLAFFGITETDVQGYLDRAKLRASPVFNVTKDGKLAFMRKFGGVG